MLFDGLTLPTILIAAGAMTVGCAFQAAVGLGFALVAAPILALVDPQFVPGPLLLAGAALAAIMAHNERAAIDRPLLSVCLIGLAAGTVIGTVALQAFGGTEQLQDLNTFCTMPPHKRLAAGSSKIFMYDYQEEWGGENVTDVAGVTDALYHPDLTSFYTVSKRSIKVWDSRRKLSKVLRDVARNEITCS